MASKLKTNLRDKFLSALTKYSRFYVLMTQADDILRSRLADEYTDFTLLHEGKEYKVHKVVICCQSEVFQKACNMKCKVSVAVISF